MMLNIIVRKLPSPHGEFSVMWGLNSCLFAFLAPVRDNALYCVTNALVLQ